MQQLSITGCSKFAEECERALRDSRVNSESFCLNLNLKRNLIYIFGEGFELKGVKWQALPTKHRIFCQNLIAGNFNDLQSSSPRLMTKESGAYSQHPLWCFILIQDMLSVLKPAKAAPLTYELQFLVCDVDFLLKSKLWYWKGPFKSINPVTLPINGKMLSLMNKPVLIKDIFGCWVALSHAKSGPVLGEHSRVWSVEDRAFGVSKWPPHVIEPIGSWLRQDSVERWRHIRVLEIATLENYGF